MAQWQIRAGATLLMPTGNAGDHLHIVLNDPRPFDGYGRQPCVLLVNLSSVRADTPYDNTCVLEPGTHVFVQHRSFIYYRYARIEPEAHILRLVGQGVFKPHEPVSAETLRTIRAGLFDSPHTKREFKRYKL
jgi:hypothetical protein